MPWKQTGWAVCSLVLAPALLGLTAADAAAQNPGKLPAPFVDGDFAQEPNPKAEAIAAQLRADPRLQVAVNLELADPTPQELLGRIQKATGVVLRLDKNLQSSDWKCGSVLAVNVPAWEILVDMAVVDLLDGSWQKTGDGYHLSGKPKPNDRPPRSRPRPAVPSPFLALEQNGLFLLANGVISAACGTLLLVRYAKRFARK